MRINWSAGDPCAVLGMCSKKSSTMILSLKELITWNAEVKWATDFTVTAVCVYSATIEN